MKKTFTLLVASAALTTAIGVPARSALCAPADGNPRPFALFEGGAKALPLILASRDDDDDDHGRHERARRGHDHEHDDDDCDDGRCRGGAANPAPADTVAPPQNGLFGTGAPPQVRVN